MSATIRPTSLLGDAALVVTILVVAFSMAGPWLIRLGTPRGEIEGLMPGDEMIPRPYCQHT